MIMRGLEARNAVASGCSRDGAAIHQSINRKNTEPWEGSSGTMMGL
jgi:hypothetical protein